MQASTFVALIFVGAFLAPVAQANTEPLDLDRCAVPCGPIPAILTIYMDKSKGVTFTDNKFESDGRVQYYFDVDNDGYVFDPDPREEIIVKMGVNKQPAWVKTTVEPAEHRIPISVADCPDCIKVDATGQAEYNYEFPIKVTVEKIREPTLEELKKATKSDGTYRIMVNAYSNDSMAGSDPTGRPAGVQEGYGIKELRFVSAAEPVFVENVAQPQANAPGIGVFGLLAAVAVGLAAVGLRRRA
jgi:hypothetical protein